MVKFNFNEKKIILKYKENEFHFKLFITKPGR